MNRILVHILHLTDLRKLLLTFCSPGKMYMKPVCHLHTETCLPSSYLEFISITIYKKKTICLKHKRSSVFSYKADQQTLAKMQE